MEDRDKRRRLSNGRHGAASGDLSRVFEPVAGSSASSSKVSQPGTGTTGQERELSDAAIRSARQTTPRAVSAPDSGADHDDGVDVELCSICLSPLEQRDRAVVQPCFHSSFCFVCIRAWSDQSRKCPLCLGPIESLAFNIRSEHDFQTLYLYPLNEPGPSKPSTTYYRATPSIPRHALYGRRRGAPADDSTRSERMAERALERRKYIYRERLFAKHIGSNRHTAFKPFSPQQFAANPDLRARIMTFVRRELQVFPTLDIPFLTSYLMSILSQMDIKSPSAIRLLSDFLSEAEAEHLAHEIVSFARSPCKTLEGYDRVSQYGRPAREMPREPQRPTDDRKRRVSDSHRSDGMRMRDEGRSRDSGRSLPVRPSSPPLSNTRRTSDSRQSLGKRSRSPPPPRLERDLEEVDERHQHSREPAQVRTSSPTERRRERDSKPTDDPSTAPRLVSIRGSASRVPVPIETSKQPSPSVLRTNETSQSSPGAETGIESTGAVTTAAARRARVQARLMEEYRTALAKAHKTSSLRSELHKRIEMEKALAAAQAAAQAEADDTLSKEFTDDDNEEEWDGVEMERAYGNRYSDETRAMLMARLQEETDYTANAVPSWQMNGKGEDDLEMQEREGREHALKALLKQKSQAREAGRTKMQELKARLWEARQKKQGQLSAAQA